MALGFDKYSHLSIPKGEMNDFDKGSVHVTTNDFFFLRAVTSREVMPHESVRCNLSTFSRAVPMERPAYVDIDIVNRAFFVPYRTVWPAFTSFYDGLPYYGKLYETVPMFKLSSLQTFIIRDGSGNLTISGSTNTFFQEFTPSSVSDVLASDYRVTDEGGTNRYFHCTRLGKNFLHLLATLGYNYPTQFGPASEGRLGDYPQVIQETTALPLLSMLRVWFDYLSPSNFDLSCRISGSGTGWSLDTTYQPDQLFSVHHFDQTGNVLSWSDFAFLAFWLTMLPYEKDMYQCITRSPEISPAESTEGLTNESLSSISLSSGIVEGHDSRGYITRWLLDGVRGLSNLVQRNNFAGIRNIDRYLAKFGITLTSEQLQRSVYLGVQKQKLDISAQMSTVATSGSPLADYAGKADSLPFEQAKFSYKATEFGQFIVVSQFIPKMPVFQGIKREMLHLKHYDFFHSDLDNLGYVAVPRAEMAQLRDAGGFSSTVMPRANFVADGVLGFLPRYYEYKQGSNQNMLTGDFRFYSTGSQSYQGMELFRHINSPFTFTERQYFIGSWSGNLDRIFVNTDSFYDHFVTYYTVSYDTKQPSRKLFDILTMPDGEHHEKVKREVGGTQL